MLEYILFIVVALVTWFIWQRHQKMNLRSRLGLDGPKTHFITGNLKQLGAANKKYDGCPFKVLEEWKNDYGNVFGFYIGPRLTVVVTDLDMAKDIFIKQFDCFVDRLAGFSGEGKAFNESLVRLKGDHWKRVRNSVTPSFTASKMKSMSKQIDEKIDILMNKFETFAQSKKSFNIYSDFQALTLDVIGQCAFAFNVNCQKDPNDLFLQNVQKFFNQGDFRLSKILQLTIVLPELGFILGKFRKFSKFGEAEKWLIEGLEKVIDERRKTFKTTESVDFLQLLLEQQEEERKIAKNNPENAKKNIEILSDDAIIGNCFVFLLAGYETTSTALGFTAWLLAKHRDVQEKLQKEIDAKLANGESVNYDLVHKLPYLDAVFHESLRVYPPIIGFLIRSCVKECTVGPVHFVPGVEVSVPTREIHMNPDIWPEPEKFNPDRFFNNNYPPMAWLPFGVGPRNCVGMRFADMEYKMVLVRMLKKYNIVLGPDSEDEIVVVEKGVLQSPKNGVKIYLEKRT